MQIKAILIAFPIAILTNVAYATDAGGGTKFNTLFLSPDLARNIDLSRFEQENYVYPGKYDMSVELNSQFIDDRSINFIDKAGFIDGRVVGACLSPGLVNKFGLTKNVKKGLVWKSGCLDYDSLAGMRVIPSIGDMKLSIYIPQAYIEYSSPFWDPPSRWDDGVSGGMFDYNVTSRVNKDLVNDNSDTNISGYGVIGLNLGAWRFRSDWQASWDMADSNNAESRSDSASGAINRVYAYRALPDWQAQVRLGEDYVSSRLFSGFRFIGGSLASDERMLPPNARGYSPEVTGVAKTDAKVIISQNGRVLHEEQVTAGPFRIQNIPSSVRGLLDVRVEEQNGQTQSFQINTINAPYLSRAGHIRYYMAAGRPATLKHNFDGSEFISADTSIGLDHNLSLLGGAQLSKNYIGTVSGVGMDLLKWGAISINRYDSRAQIKDKKLSGTSYSINYSKDFETINSTLSLASYRYSQQNYMGMNEFLSTTNDYFHDWSDQHEKNSFTASISTAIPVVGGSSYISIDKSTYYDRPDSSRYNISFSKAFPFIDYQTLSATISMYKSEGGGGYGSDDVGGYLSLSIPLGDGDMNYMGNINNGQINNSVGYAKTLDASNYYSINAGLNSGEGTSFSGNYTHTGSSYELNSVLSYQPAQYESFSLGLKGGVTVTQYGVALNRNDRPGGTRVMVDLDGVPDVPIRGNGSVVTSNEFGTAVIPNVSDYNRQRINVDLDKLPLGTDVAAQSVKEKTYTEGAIGYWHIGARSGKQSMVQIVKNGHNYPPFGARIINDDGHEVGLVGDAGGAYLTGLHPSDTLHVNWSGHNHCNISIPNKIKEMMTLQCHA